MRHAASQDRDCQRCSMWTVDMGTDIESGHCSNGGWVDGRNAIDNSTYFGISE